MDGHTNEQPNARAYQGFQCLPIRNNHQTRQIDESQKHAILWNLESKHSLDGAYAEYVPPQADFLTLRVEANNITDEEYADRASYGQDFATVEQMLEPGRSFLFKLRAEF